MVLMSLLLRQVGKARSVRSSLLILSNGFSSSLRETPPSFIVDAYQCGEDLGRLVISNVIDHSNTFLEKKVPLELMDKLATQKYKYATVTIGASHGWVATLKEDGILRLQDDLNPAALDSADPKRIPLPPLVTLPHCQTKIVTNVSMSSSSPEDEDCVVAVKFLGPQLSFCRPAQSNPEWINIRIENSCFYSSTVMFSKKHDMFRIPGSGGNIIGSWDLGQHLHKPKFQSLEFPNLPELAKTKRELLDSCCTSEHLVESTTTGETFMVKLYKKATSSGKVKLKTKAVMVFKLDEQGNAVYTKDIGDVCIFISRSEPFCVTASSYPGMDANSVQVLDVDEHTLFDLDYFFNNGNYYPSGTPYFIPPQKLDYYFGTESWSYH